MMYTDGYSEIFDEAGEMFGDERVRDTILDHADGQPDEIIEALESDIANFLDGSDHGDDRTIVVIKVGPLTKQP